MTVLGVIQARMGSGRLPGKVLLPLGGRPAIEHVVRAVQTATMIDRLVVATTSLGMDDAIEDAVAPMRVPVFRGEVDDVLSRFVGAIGDSDESVIVRFTADDPLLDPAVIDTVVKRFFDVDSDHVSNMMERSWPRGLDTEVVSREALMRCHNEATLQEDREHVTLYLRRHPEWFGIDSVTAPPEETWPEARFCLDTQQDYQMLAAVFDAIWEGEPLAVGRVITWLRRHPEIARLNSEVPQTVVLGKEY